MLLNGKVVLTNVGGHLMYNIIPTFVHIIFKVLFSMTYVKLKFFFFPRHDNRYCIFSV